MYIQKLDEFWAQYKTKWAQKNPTKIPKKLKLAQGNISLEQKNISFDEDKITDEDFVARKLCVINIKALLENLHEKVKTINFSNLLDALKQFLKEQSEKFNSALINSNFYKIVLEPLNKLLFNPELNVNQQRSAIKKNILGYSKPLVPIQIPDSALSISAFSQASPPGGPSLIDSQPVESMSEIPQAPPLISAYPQDVGDIPIPPPMPESDAPPKEIQLDWREKLTGTKGNNDEKSAPSNIPNSVNLAQEAANQRAKMNARRAARIAEAVKNSTEESQGNGGNAEKPISFSLTSPAMNPAEKKGKLSKNPENPFGTVQLRNVAPLNKESEKRKNEHEAQPNSGKKRKIDSTSPFSLLKSAMKSRRRSVQPEEESQSGADDNKNCGPASPEPKKQLVNASEPVITSGSTKTSVHSISKQSKINEASSKAAASESGASLDKKPEELGNKVVSKNEQSLSSGVGSITRGVQSRIALFTDKIEASKNAQNSSNCGSRLSKR